MLISDFPETTQVTDAHTSPEQRVYTQRALPRTVAGTTITVSTTMSAGTAEHSYSITFNHYSQYRHTPSTSWKRPMYKEPGGEGNNISILQF